MEGNMQQNNDKRTDRKFSDRRKSNFSKEVSEFDKKLVDVRRVTKVVTGGRTLRFSALVVVGNKKGKVGIGIGKASEVPNAIEKATQDAKKHLASIVTYNTTIPHEVIGKFGKAKVILLPSKEGSGVVAGGSVRPVVELAGIKDLTAKVYGSRNKINCVRATLDALLQLRSKDEIAFLRGKSVDEI